MGSMTSGENQQLCLLAVLFDFSKIMPKIKLVLLIMLILTRKKTDTMLQVFIFF